MPAELSGGGSLQPDSYPLPIVVSKEPAPFGVAAVWAGSFEADGSPSTQAGGHPFTGAAYFMVNTRRTASGAINPSGDSKNVIVDLPPGFTGNPLATQALSAEHPARTRTTAPRSSATRKCRSATSTPISALSKKPCRSGRTSITTSRPKATRPSSPPGSSSRCKACWRRSTAKRTTASASSRPTTPTTRRSTVPSPPSKACRNSATAKRC